MTTRFYCTWRGRKLYRVIRGREELFCGSREECKRYLAIHALKEEKARVAEGRQPRRRHPTFRIFRIASRGTARAAV